MKKVIYIIVLIIIIVGGFTLVIENKENSIDNKEESVIKYVSMDEIVQIMNENSDYVILDVRTMQEYNEGHIPNAICIPNETIGEDIINKLPNKEQLILIYCRSGNRSATAANTLINLGYKNVYDLGAMNNCSK